MKNFIKNLFDLYDKNDITKIRNTAYLEGYRAGEKYGELTGLIMGYTPNQIRELMGLPPLENIDKGDEDGKQSNN